VHEVVERKLPAPAVLQPLLAYLVAAYVEVPDILGNALEVLRLVDVNVARLAVLVGNELGEALFDEVVSRHRIASDELGKLGGLQQMQCCEFLTQEAKLVEEVEAGSQGNPGKVDLQELNVALAVGRRMEDGIDIVENVIRPEGSREVTATVGDELEIEA